MLLCVRSLSNFSTASLAFSEESYGNDSGLAVYVAKAIDPTLCWDDIAWLKSHTCLPVIVKGVLNGTDKSSKLIEFIKILNYHYFFWRRHTSLVTLMINLHLPQFPAPPLSPASSEVFFLSSGLTTSSIVLAWETAFTFLKSPPDAAPHQPPFFLWCWGFKPSWFDGAMTKVPSSELEVPHYLHTFVWSTNDHFSIDLSIFNDQSGYIKVVSVIISFHWNW